MDRTRSKDARAPRGPTRLRAPSRAAVLAAALAAAAAGLAGAAADPYEEDDGCFASEAVIRGGETQNRNFEDDAEDWASFNACAGRSYAIEASNLGVFTDTVPTPLQGERHHGRS